MPPTYARTCSSCQSERDLHRCSRMHNVTTTCLLTILYNRSWYYELVKPMHFSKSKIHEGKFLQVSDSNSSWWKIIFLRSYAFFYYAWPLSTSNSHKRERVSFHSLTHVSNSLRGVSLITVRSIVKLGEWIKLCAHWGWLITCNYY